MRITNGILINNSLANINTNKVLMDKLNTQLTSEKKITRPSDDPIVAIRALRFRSTLSEISQYLDKNIPDASAWMEATDEALGNTVKLISSITEYCNQAVNGQYDETNKNTIVETLKAYRDQIYSDANADCAGRSIFTGYKTDGTLTFTSDNDKKYEITQQFTSDSFDTVKKITNSVDISNINATNVGDEDVASKKLPINVEAYRVRLAYSNLDAASGLTIKTKTAGGDTNIPVTTMNSTDAGAYEPGGDSVYYLQDTGELIFGKDAYTKTYESDSFEFTYSKTGFNKGELDPTQYFDCVDKTAGSKTYDLQYKSTNQEIKYEVNFNQELTINTQGKNVFDQDMTRDLDEIINAVNKAIDVTNNKEKLTSMYESAEDGSKEKEKLQQLIDLCDRELDFATENMTNAFSKGLGQFTKHQDKVSLARSDVGARQNRLELNESRLESQKITVKNLKSTNEDVNVTDIAVELKEASSIYDASLAAAAKVVQNKLLDFL